MYRCAAAASAHEHLVENGGEALPFERFGQVGIGVVFPTLDTIAFGARRGQDDDGYVACRIQRSDALQQAEAIHHRHHQIQDDTVG